MSERYTRAHPDRTINVPVYRTIGDALDHKDEHPVLTDYMKVYKAGVPIPTKTLVAYVRNRCHYWTYADFGKGMALAQHDAETHS
jgi:hypothetical protein